MWIYSDKHDCHGQVGNAICNFAVGDLETIRNSNCLTANKFNLKVDATAVLCQLQYIKAQNEIYFN